MSAFSVSLMQADPSVASSSPASSPLDFSAERLGLDSSASPSFIDTHTHLDLTASKLGLGVPALVQLAQQHAAEAHGAFFAGCLHVSCSLPSLLEIDSFLASCAPLQPPSPHPFLLRLALGIHPHDASAWDDATTPALLSAALTRHPAAVAAVGECGLDYHYMNSPRDAQLRAFKAQVSLAVSLGLPVVVHSREADDDTLAVLSALLPTPEGSDRPRWPVHVHCFTGGAPFALALLALSDGLCIGLTGAVTFASAKGLHEAVRQIPLERLLLETDAPFMAPVPHRGKTCHSGMVPLVVQRIAQLKGVEQGLVYSQLRENTRKLYGF